MEFFGIRYDPVPANKPDVQVEAETDMAFDEDSGIGRSVPVLVTLDAVTSLVHAIVYGSGKLVGANPWYTP